MLTRAQLLKLVRDNGVAWRWKDIATWLEQMVRVEPKIMREVSRATFGELGNWIQKGTDNVDDVCGCLIGTVAVKLIKQRNSFKFKSLSWGDHVSVVRTKDNPNDEYDGKKGCEVEASTAVCELVKGNAAFKEYMKEQTDQIGMEVYELGMELDEPTVVELIRSEIKFQLAKRGRARNKRTTR